LQFVSALGPGERYEAVKEDLQKRTERVRKHQQEQKAHRRNVRTGRVRRSGDKK